MAEARLIHIILRLSALAARPSAKANGVLKVALPLLLSKIPPESGQPKHRQQYFKCLVQTGRTGSNEFVFFVQIKGNLSEGFYHMFLLCINPSLKA